MLCIKTLLIRDNYFLFRFLFLMQILLWHYLGMRSITIYDNDFISVINFFHQKYMIVIITNDDYFIWCSNSITVLLK